MGAHYDEMLAELLEDGRRVGWCFGFFACCSLVCELNGRRGVDNPSLAAGQTDRGLAK